MIFGVNQSYIDIEIVKIVITIIQYKYIIIIMVVIKLVIIYEDIDELSGPMNAGTVIHKPKILAEELVSLSFGIKNLK